jgi:hypothetical protein
MAQCVISATQEAEEDQGWRPAQAKSEWDPISTNKPGMTVQACDPSYSRGAGRRIVVQVHLGIKQDPISKNNQTKKGWELS